jgi:hypothetical protein
MAVNVPSSDSGGFTVSNSSYGGAPASGGSSGGAGGAGSSGGSGGGGTTAQPGPGSGAASMISSMMFDVNRLAADRTEYGPPIFLGSNDSVSVMPKRSNTQPCFVSTGGNSDAKFPPRLQLASTDNPVPVGVRTLREIGVYSTVVGEGVTIIVNRRA